MDARSARKYSKEDWSKLASEAENKIEGRLFINGEYVDATDGGKFEVINPATNEVYATVAAGTEKDIDKAVAAAKFPQDLFQSTSGLSTKTCAKR